MNEVLQRTHTTYAPWTVVEANDKEYARIKVLQTVIDAMEKRLGTTGTRNDGIQPSSYCLIHFFGELSSRTGTRDSA